MLTAKTTRRATARSCRRPRGAASWAMCPWRGVWVHGWRSVPIRFKRSSVAWAPKGKTSCAWMGPLPCWGGRAGICRPFLARTGGALAGRAAWSTGTTILLGWALAFSGAVLRRQTVFGSAGWGHGTWMCLWPRRKTRGWCRTSRVVFCFLACA